MNLWKIACCAAGLLNAQSAIAQSIALDYLRWNFAVDGSATDGDSQLDFERDLDVRPRSRGLYALDWRTGPGWWPDVAARYTPLRAGGVKTVTQETQVLGIVIDSSTTTVAADANLDDVELILRYPFDAGQIRFAPGLTLRQLRGDILIQEEGDSDGTREHIDRRIPMVHLQAEWGLREWLQLEAAGNYVAHQDDRAADYRVQLTASWNALRLSGGWQSKSFRIHSSSYLLDVELAGAFAGLGLEFGD